MPRIEATMRPRGNKLALVNVATKEVVKEFATKDALLDYAWENDYVVTMESEDYS